MKGETWADLLQEYGAPIISFSPSGIFTAKERMQFSVPRECAVFEIPGRPDQITYARYSLVEWHANDGHRWVIRELLINAKKVQP